jgi:hypothetical protein
MKITIKKVLTIIPKALLLVSTVFYVVDLAAAIWMVFE